MIVGSSVFYIIQVFKNKVYLYRIIWEGIYIKKNISFLMI